MSSPVLRLRPVEPGAESVPMIPDSPDGSVLITNVGTVPTVIEVVLGSLVDTAGRGSSPAFQARTRYLGNAGPWTSRHLLCPGEDGRVLITVLIPDLADPGTYRGEIRFRARAVPTGDRLPSLCPPVA